MNQRPPRILVAPLNWGLGHATRCIPIVRALQAQGAEVILASDGRPLELLRAEFPALPALSLPSYGIRYDSSSMVWNMLRQCPKLALAIAREHALVEKWVAEHGLDGIISDNRFGCYSCQVRSVFVTHQLFIPTPLPHFLERWVWRMNAHFIQKFNECWVPDAHRGGGILSGKLSHPECLNSKRALSALEVLTGIERSTPVRYIGALSRMERFPVEKKYDVVAVLSGPEPQRSRLEDLFVEKAKQLSLRCLLVQGKTERQEHFFIRTPPASSIEVYSHLSGRALNEAMLSGKVILSRSGYTTVMDLAKLGIESAIFIPTPGQTEQEYLAEHFHKAGIFLRQKQGEFDLQKALEELGRYGGLQGAFFDGAALRDAVSKSFNIASTPLS